MGYRSEIAFKTTTEGFLLIKKWNDEIKERADRPLQYLEIHKTSSGFYKLSHDYIKWYDSYPEIHNFEEFMSRLTEQNIPWAFVRIGEERDDIEFRNNWVDDMPDELETFEPTTSIYDEDESDYELVEEGGE